MRFPHPCGEEFERQVAAGADPLTVVPDDFVIVHGGTTDIPPPGTKYSGACGPSVEDAAVAVPHGQLRSTTAGAIRARGGTVEWEPEVSRYRTINRQHVNITEAGPTAFSEVYPNPLPSPERIDGDQQPKKRSRP